LKTHPVWHPEGRFWALRKATKCRGHGAEIRSPKSCDAAEWLAIQNNSSCHNSDSEQQLLPRHHTNPISPPRERDTWLSKKRKKYIFSKRVIFRTDCRQSMGLQFVLKPKVKTSKLCALQALPYKCSKLWVNLDEFFFSKKVVNLVYNIFVPFMLFYLSNITLLVGYSTLVQQIYLLLKILLVYALQSNVLLECLQLKS
jgi:hypothetical protein